MPQALVVGGGVSGPVAAIALQHVGYEPVVYEARDRAADGRGGFLSVAAAGLSALDTLGILTPIEAVGIPTPRMSIYTGDGRLLMTASTLRGGVVSRTMSRSTLYVALREQAVERGVRIEYGKRLVDAEVSEPDRVVAHFSDGSDAAGALLVGADGLWSRTRGLLDPAAPTPRYLGLLNTGGYARGIDPPSPPGVLNLVHGTRCFFGYIGNDHGEVWWFANPVQAREHSAAELATITPAQWRAHLLDLFATDASPAADIIQATTDIAAPWNSYDLPPVPTWHSDHIVIVGDAAHAAAPASGQGAAMAIEDAVVLADCVQATSSFGSAFADYDRRRREHVERIVEEGRRYSTPKLGDAQHLVEPDGPATRPDSRPL